MVIIDGPGRGTCDILAWDYFIWQFLDVKYYWMGYFLIVSTSHYVKVTFHILMNLPLFDGLAKRLFMVKLFLLVNITVNITL